MEQYIGTKIVHAEPVVKVKGYLYGIGEIVPRHDEDAKYGYKVFYPDGYVSWSPKEVFEEAYRLSDGMNFGLAIEAMKKGKKVARHGWNGKGMWVIYRTGYPDGIACNKNTCDAMGIPEGTVVKIRPYLQMKCADGTYQMWLASQSDMLADDWYIVE